MTTVFNLSLTAYFVALLLAAVDLFSHVRRLKYVVAAALGAGLTVQSVYIVMRWVAAGRAPMSNMFESLVVFSWATVLTYFLIRSRVRLPVVAAGTALLAVLALAYASAFESDIKPLMPALRSNWLTVHVFTAFLGYGAFAVAFVASVSFLIAAGRNSAETASALEESSGKAISFGFLFLTVGIISGAVWANSAWGSYWQWDPKETWSLITWFVYAVYLHCRFMRGWRGRRAAWISIAGFASVILTYFGVNLLMSGLHSYA
jgi:ABC-type transport system involved in cytochrome c biogenesis permease subunit